MEEQKNTQNKINAIIITMLALLFIGQLVIGFYTIAGNKMVTDSIGESMLQNNSILTEVREIKDMEDATAK